MREDVDTIDQLKAELAALRCERDALARRLASAETGEDHERKFRHLFEMVPIGIALIDLQGHLHEANPSFQALLGYSDEELRLLTYADITHPDDVLSTHQLFEELSEGRRDSYELEKRYLRKDGRVLWAHVAASLVRASDGTPSFALGIVDVTARRLAQEAMRESWENYQRLVELSPDPIAVHDGTHLVYVNPAAVRLMRAKAPEDMIGKPVFNFVPPEFQAVVARRIREAKDKGLPLPLLEERMIRLDGSLVDVEIAGTQLIYQGKPAVQLIARDITERREAEAQIAHHMAEIERLNAELRLRNQAVESQIAERTEALRESEEKFRTIFERAAIGIALGSLEALSEGRMAMTMNQALQEMLGYTHEELNAIGIDRLSPLEDAAEDRQQFMSLLSGEHDFYQLEKRYIRKDGSIIWGNLFVSLIRDNDGRPRFIIALVENISERKRIEQSLREQIDKERELNRLKADLVNAVSHELRTPLTSIMGYAEFLEDEVGGPLSETQQGFVTQIQEGTLRLQRLVDDLLDFARLEAGTFKLELERADMTRKIREVVESLRPQARDKHVTLLVEEPDAPEPVVIDAGRIGQVLINIIGNAIKFTPVDGQVTVRLSSDPDTLTVSVTDTGVGIDKAHQASLFEKFFQVDASSTREKGGAGLGLSIAKALVEAHHGQIGVESAPGAGSTFWFRLPRNNGLSSSEKA